MLVRACHQLGRHHPCFLRVVVRDGFAQRVSNGLHIALRVNGQPRDELFDSLSVRR